MEKSVEGSKRLDSYMSDESQARQRDRAERQRDSFFINDCIDN
jgi:hypothetical protein